MATETASDVSAPDLLAQAVPLYGPDDCWRARNGHLYATDAALRWTVDAHRAELVAAGALAKFGARLFAIEPAFSALMLDYARADVGAKRCALLVAARKQASDNLKPRGTGNGQSSERG